MITYQALSAFHVKQFPEGII